MAAPTRPAAHGLGGPPRPGFQTTVTYEVPLEHAVELFEFAKDKGLSATVYAETGNRGRATVAVQASDNYNPVFETAWRACWDVHEWLTERDLAQ